MITTAIISIGANREQDLIHALGPIVFLDEEFQPIRHRLAEAAEFAFEEFEAEDGEDLEADAIGADAILHPGGGLAFQQNQVEATVPIVTPKATKVIQIQGCVTNQAMIAFMGYPYRIANTSCFLAWYSGEWQGGGGLFV